MEASDGTKSCPMCCSEISAKAIKCPHCQHFQRRTVMLMHHPAVAVALATAPLLFMLFFIGSMLDPGKPYESFRDQIEVVESHMSFGETKAGDTVAVIGTVQNKSPVPWENVVFQVEFVDAAGSRIDAGQKLEYSMRLPAKESLGFKVSLKREFPKEQYAKHSVRIVAAKDARARF
jgi:hypothetical protein